MRQFGTKWLVIMTCVVAVAAFAGCERADQGGEGTAATPAAGGGEATQELTAEARASIAQEIVQRNQELVATWANPDSFDNWMAFYVGEGHPSWAQGRTHLVVNTQVYGSRGDIESTFRPLLANRATKITMQDESVAVLSANDAVHFGTFTFSHTTDGAASEEYQGAATTVWTKDGDQWKVLHYHQSWPNKTPVAAATEGAGAAAGGM